MNRFLVCLVAALAFALFRGGATNPGVTPEKPVVVVPAPIPSIGRFRDQMTADERTALAECYGVLSRSVAANPVDDPIIPTVAALNDVHRASLLFVWRGVLGNQPGKYEGLREELEGLLRDKVGVADVPLNPAVQRDAASLFDELSRSFR
jgi:hypothetical protein